MAVYGDPNSLTPSYKSLDRHHTHFICVDDGTDDQFGGEVLPGLHVLTCTNLACPLDWPAGRP